MSLLFLYFDHQSNVSIIFDFTNLDKSINSIKHCSKKKKRNKTTINSTKKNPSPQEILYLKLSHLKIKHSRLGILKCRLCYYSKVEENKHTRTRKKEKEKKEFLSIRDFVRYFIPIPALPHLFIHCEDFNCKFPQRLPTNYQSTTMLPPLCSAIPLHSSSSPFKRSPLER